MAAARNEASHSQPARAQSCQYSSEHISERPCRDKPCGGAGVDPPDTEHGVGISMFGNRYWGGRVRRPVPLWFGRLDRCCAGRGYIRDRDLSHFQANQGKFLTRSQDRRTAIPGTKTHPSKTGMIGACSMKIRKRPTIRAAPHASRCCFVTS